MIKILSIARYPFKGLSPENLDSAVLYRSRAIHGDRRFAFCKQKDVAYDSQWRGKQQTLCLMQHPKLARLRTKFSEDKNQISVETEEEKEISCNLDEREQVLALENYVSKYVGEDHCRLLDGFSWQAKEGGDGHYCDNESNYISIVNNETLLDLSKIAGLPLAVERFRANLYLSGLPPWRERDWIGKRIKINDSILLVESEISRCQAVNVDLGSGEIDVYLPKILIKNCRHNYCGIFARVERGGSIDIGAEVTEIT